MGNSVSRSRSFSKEATPTLSLKLADKSSNSISGGIADKKEPNTPIHVTSPMTPMTQISPMSPTLSPMSPITVTSAISVIAPPNPPQTPLEQYLSYSLPSTPIPSDKGVQDDDIKCDVTTGFPSIPLTVPHSNTRSVSKSQSISTMKINDNNNNNNNIKKKRFFFRKKKSQKDAESNIKQQEKHKKKGNGIIGVYISKKKKTAQNLYVFWVCNIERLYEIEKLEIAVLIYFTMIDSLKDNDFKTLYKGKKIEQTALSFLDMIQWLIHSVNDDEIDLYLKLKTLGKMHKYLGVKLQFFEAYLSALHSTLSEYFPNQYKIDIKYCLDEIFTVCAQIMVGKPPIPKYQKHIIDEELPKQTTPSTITPSSSFIGISGLLNFQESRSMKQKNIWLKDLNSCLQSEIGKEYFFRYLEQTACYEIVMFLKLYWQFKRCMSEKEKFMVSRKILKTCIDHNNYNNIIHNTSTFPINISYETKMNFIKNMQFYEDEWKIQCKSPKDDNINNQLNNQSNNQSNNFKDFNVESNLLEEMLFETKKLILNNHWRKFCLQIELMGMSPSQSMSFDDY